MGKDLEDLEAVSATDGEIVVLLTRTSDARLAFAFGDDSEWDLTDRAAQLFLAGLKQLHLQNEIAHVSSSAPDNQIGTLRAEGFATAHASDGRATWEVPDMLTVFSAGLERAVIAGLSVEAGQGTGPESRDVVGD